MSTQTAEIKSESAAEPQAIQPPAPMVLKGVSYRQYVAFRNHPDNSGLRLTYHNGTLEIMSPQFIHEVPSRWLGVLIPLVAGEFGIAYHGGGTTTFHLEGESEQKGFGKEPDQCFYFANLSRVIRKRDLDLDQGDPPPDLWIEVDNRSSSLGKLPLYAALGVPEVWRYQAQTGKIWFGKLMNGEYETLERSLSLPMLTPSLVMEAMALGTGLAESEWHALLKPWMAEHLKPQA